MRVKFVAYPALRQLAHWRMPRLAALLLVLASRPLKAKDRPAKPGKRPYRALVLNLNKPGFQEDIEDSLLEADTFEVVTWPTYALKAMAEAILSPALSNVHYDTGDAADEASKLAYRKFLAAVWKHYCAIKPVDVVLCANFGYYAQQEFAAALEEAGTPYIALHKENVKSNRRVQFWHSVYEKRGPFAGRKILVYNDVERELQVSSGIVEPKKVLVTGMPRLDRIHRWRREHAGQDTGGPRPQVLLLAFWSKEKLTPARASHAANIPAAWDEGEAEAVWDKLSWSVLSEGTHRAMAQLALARPDIDVVVKTKAHARKIDDILRLLDIKDGTPPPNLKVVSGGDPFPLIARSHVVIGFNTTALLEALAAGKPVVMPWFGEAAEPGMHDLVIHMGEAVGYARSPEELMELVAGYVDRPAAIPRDLPAKMAEALRHWTGNDDGAAGRRVLEAVCHELAARA